MYCQWGPFPRTSLETQMQSRTRETFYIISLAKDAGNISWSPLLIQVEHNPIFHIITRFVTFRQEISNYHFSVPTAFKIVCTYLFVKVFYHAIPLPTDKTFVEWPVIHNFLDTCSVSHKPWFLQISWIVLISSDLNYPHFIRIPLVRRMFH